MHEQEVKIQSGEIVLTGTLCTPHTDGKFPSVLMVHGSGPLDRNANMKGQQLNIFNELAHAFADRGIASLRYDKRGCGSSSGSFITAGYSDLVRDAEQCLDALVDSKYVSGDQVYILGHSEGCTIAPLISRRRPSVSGLILLCPTIERVETLLLRQAMQIEKEINSLRGPTGYLYRALLLIMGRPLHNQQRLIRKVRKSDLPVVRFGLSRQPAKWLREILELDAEAIFTSTNTPMLLIAGEKDLQCNPQDIYLIAEAVQGQSETLVVDGMTHLLRVDEHPATLLGSVRFAGRPVESAVVEKAAQWILATTAANNQLREASRAGVNKGVEAGEKPPSWL